MSFKKLKRYNLKSFHIEGDNDIEIIISKKQILKMYDYLVDERVTAVVYYLNERLDNKK